MTRRHRLVHRLIWPLLAVLVALGVGWALTMKPAAGKPTAIVERHA
ncbi:MAG: hypothetical protein AB7O45_06845 [Alphaproteobacteria bacterium]